MRELFRFSVIVLVASALPALAQNETVEIPLDDFPRFVEGYRIQVGAFSMEQAALTLRDSLSDLFNENLNLKYEHHLWRVRIGEFVDRSEAEQFLIQEIRPAGFHDAQLVPEKVRCESKSVFEHPMVNGFRIQINALTDGNQALELGRRLDFNYTDVRAYVLRQDSIYKVQFGDFSDRQEAERWLEILKEDNVFPIWIVPTSVYKNPLPSPIERPETDPFKFMD